MKIILTEDSELLAEKVQQTISASGNGDDSTVLLYYPHDHIQAVQKTIELMQSVKRLFVYPLSATIETMLASKVLQLPSAQEIRENAQDAWDFLVKNAPTEDVLALLARRYHKNLREPGEFDSVIDKLARRTRLRRRALRIMYGKIRTQLFPNTTTTTRKRYPWWKHLKK